MEPLTILYVADICGKAGRQATAHMVKPLKERYSASYVIANVENAAAGFGITPEMARKVFAYGVNVQTSGNHIWDRHEIIRYLEENPKLLRPANYPQSVPGQGVYVEMVGNVAVATMNLMGRTYMRETDCPFYAAERELEKLKDQTPVVFVDFHAEATSEKQAMLYFLDGKVSAVIGSHTHVQTADEQITRQGTAYITDAGMTGAHDSVIGMEKEPSLYRFLTGLPRRFTTATEDIKISGVILKIDPLSGRAENIERYRHDFNLQDFRPEDLVVDV